MAFPSAEAIGSAAAAQASGENFPVALRLLPGRYRRRLEAVYGFARAVDDMGDEAPPGERARLLDVLEADLGRLYQFQDPALREEPAGDPAPGSASVPPGPAQAGPQIGVVRALAPVVGVCAIPQQAFADLIRANRQDQVVSRYPRFSDLVGYCRLSANPVGRIVLHVFGAATPERMILSDRVCTALQLAEHWQDVAEDFRAGRIYLPAEDLERFGVAESDLAAAAAGPQLRALMAFEVERARQLLDEGAPLVGNLRGSARVAVAGYVAGGRAALAAITKAGHDVLCATHKPRRGRLAREMLRAYAAGR
ncbi:MAG TPA: squalene synthase HpnC [Streptosporangiaceae bacterium]|nr:squalene synthase HpnC [Streptosporangiaceae bacterium]